MVKYFVPSKITADIIERIDEYQFKNDYNKAIAEFDSSNMNAEKQFFHNLMKLKASVTREVYSNEIESISKELLNSFKDMKDNIIEVSEKAESMLIKTIEYCFNQKKLFIDALDNNGFADGERVSEGMAVNYRMKYLSYEFVTKLDETTDLDAIRKALNAKLEPIRPINDFRKLVKESEGKTLTFEAWIGDLKVNAPVQDIIITDNDITIKIPYAVYHLKKSTSNVSIHKTNSWNRNEEYEWQYVLFGNGEVTVGLKK
ncbi:hypothetical protein R0131_18035 [Clostridium sp. AL.422]|uniref:hypothetical protein n=1 Tax=Clostridium TaxID=1485 RepID=UPI00293DC48E|nr:MULTISPECIES: hypothetical protein [unclassified Clostridium]MDV4152732.1 hypothetical protein [Clostridium sp. AL.422]